MNIYLVVFQTADKKVYRLLKQCRYSLADINSYDWIVIDIQILHNGYFITLDSYSILKQYNRELQIKRNKKKEKIGKVIDLLHDIFN